MIELTKGFDEYVNQIVGRQNSNNLPDSNFKDGLFELDKNKYQLYNQCIVFENEIFFPHAFLRRNGRGNFLGIIQELNYQIKRGNVVQIRLDPFEKRQIEKLDEINAILEHDSWFGPKFSNDILDKNDNFSVTLHCTNKDDSAVKRYPVKYTIFRPSWLDKNKNIIQYYIEELLLTKSDKKFHLDNPIPYCSENYVVQKFVHFTYDRNEKIFEHIDASVRIFEFEEYQKIFAQIESGKVYDKHIPGVERYKLFKIQGRLELKDMANILKLYLYGNQHISEYFDSEWYLEERI